MLLAALLAAPAGAADVAAGPIAVAAAHAFATPPGARAGAGYLAITNRGERPDRLEAVRIGRGAATLHRTETGADGVARMRPAAGLEIGPGETAVLEPGATHVMFTGLAGPLVAGETLEAVLVFGAAGELAVAFDVVPRGAAPAHRH